MIEVAELRFQWEVYADNNVDDGGNVTRIDVTLPGSESNYMVNVADRVAQKVSAGLPFEVSGENDTTQTFDFLIVPIQSLQQMAVSAYQSNDEPKAYEFDKPSFESGEKYVLIVSLHDHLLLTLRVVKAASAAEWALKSEEQLENLDVPSLQSVLDSALVRAKQYAVSRLKATLSGKVRESNAFLQCEVENGLYVSTLREKIRNKGETPKFPETPEYSALVAEEENILQANAGAVCVVM